MRLMKDFVAQCVANVVQCTSRLARLRTGREFALALHGSVMIMLRDEVARLMGNNADDRILSPLVRTEIRRWMSRDIEPQRLAFIRMRATRWSTTLCEMLQRLDRDWTTLVRILELDTDVAISAISQPLGDFHQGGRSVFKVAFENGRAVIYKPRQVDTEYTFGRTVDWFCRGGFTPTLNRCRVLPRDGYGWLSYVTPQPCQTLEAVGAYCERQGVFLTIFFLLCGYDCLDENVINNGEHPVWIDTECMCVPGWPEWMSPRQFPAWMRESVLATGLIFQGNVHGLPPRSRCGLNVTCVQPRSAIYTDDDVLKDPYLTAVIKGFTKAYEWVFTRREQWLSEHGVLSWWRNLRVRVLPRSTAQYAALAYALAIAPLDSRARASSCIADTLRVGTETTSWPEEIVVAEMRALERGDIPYWSSSMLGGDLRESNGYPIRDVSRVSGLAHTRARLTRMSAADLKNQTWLIDTHLRLPNRPYMKAVAS